MAADQPDEQSLITQAKQGNLEAFNTLVLNYQDIVFTVTYRIMGEREAAADAAQDAFINAYRRITTFRGGSFRSWLLRIATNTSYDHLRYKRRRPAAYFDELSPSEDEDDPPIADTEDTPEEAAQKQELNGIIQKCIDALKDSHRVVLVMSDIEGFNYQEIADTVGTQLGTVKSRLSRARASLRDCLRSFGELLPPRYRQ